MRNLKRVLALALALVMTIGLLIVGSSAASYKDYTDTNQIDEQYVEAVQVLSNIGVFRGTSLTNDETFAPKQILDRQSASTLVYRVLTGDVTDAQLQNYAYPSEFSDVKETSWANPYINYAAIVKYVVGDGTGRFLPDKEVTGVEVLTIMLRAIGYGQNDEFTGAGWKDEAITKANELGLLAGISTDDLISGASRELVAQLLFNAITIPNTVTYSAALGYVETESPLGTLSPKNPTLGAKVFGLEKTAGEITAVGRKAGTTTLRDKSTAANGTDIGVGTSVDLVVTGTSTPWTDIGYGAYVWTVATTGVKTREAVSDLVVTGKSLKVTTDGTAAIETNKVNGAVNYSVKGLTIESSARVYFNGEYIGQLYETKNNQSTLNTAVKDVLDLAELRGVKVDYIDNDNGGRIETIVVTQYNTAQVSAIVSAGKTTGSQGVEEDTTYLRIGDNALNPNAVVAVVDSNLVTEANLAVGDWVTFVEYPNSRDAKKDGDFYVTETTVIADKFTNRNVSSSDVVSYVIGGETYFVSDLEFVTNLYDTNGKHYTGAATQYLGDNTNKNTNVSIYTDPYGYIVYAEEEQVADSYLYVLANKRTDPITGLTDALVAFTDGTITTVQVTDQRGGIYDSSNDKENDNYNVLSGAMYSYTLDRSGNYKLVRVQNHDTGDYTAKTATFYGSNGTVAVDRATVVVDLRNYRTGDTSAEVYTGYNEIPSVDEADLWYAVKTNGLNTGSTITYAFLVDDVAYEYQSFIVYQTSKYTENTGTNNKTASVTLPVVIDGENTTIQLTNEQFAEVQKYGVGIYDFTLKPIGRELQIISEEYTAFNEVSGVTTTWSNGRISVNYNNAALGGQSGVKHYTYTDDDVISVLNIGEKGGVSAFTLARGADINVYVVTGKGDAVEHIYVIVDVDDDIDGVKNADGKTSVNDVPTNTATNNARPTQLKGYWLYTYATFKNGKADDLTVAVSRVDTRNTTNRPTVNKDEVVQDIDVVEVSDWTAVKAPTGVDEAYEVTIPFSVWSTWAVLKDEDGNITAGEVFTIKPAADNQIAIGSLKTFSTATQTVFADLPTTTAGGSQVITVYSQSTRTGEVTGVYQFTVKYDKANGEAELISNDDKVATVDETNKTIDVKNDKLSITEFIANFEVSEDSEGAEVEWTFYNAQGKVSPANYSQSMIDVTSFTAVVVAEDNTVVTYRDKTTADALANADAAAALKAAKQAATDELNSFAKPLSAEIAADQDSYVGVLAKTWLEQYASSADTSKTVKTVLDAELAKIANVTDADAATTAMLNGKIAVRAEVIGAATNNLIRLVNGQADGTTGTGKEFVGKIWDDEIDKAFDAFIDAVTAELTLDDWADGTALTDVLDAYNTAFAAIQNEIQEIKTAAVKAAVKSAVGIQVNYSNTGTWTAFVNRIVARINATTGYTITGAAVTNEVPATYAQGNVYTVNYTFVYEGVTYSDSAIVTVVA